ncbi:MAG: porin family protein [bacterium]|nr:porin family protein [bacterium]
MNHYPFLLTLSGILLAGGSVAGTMGPIHQTSERVWVGTLSMGSTWPTSAEAQTFFLAPEIEKTYAASKLNSALPKLTSALFDGEVFIGMQQTIAPVWQAQFGLAVAATSNVRLKGEIWDDADSEFNNLAYSYKIQHTHIAFKGKLLADNGYWVTPWLSASAGVAFNNSTSFNNTPLIFEALANPNFTSHSQTAFTYTVGAGVQKALTTNWQVGVGYEFADWGKSQLGRAPDQVLNSGLGQNHLYTNGLLFNLTYIT